jgi:hypothetical protein
MMVCAGLAMFNLPVVPQLASLQQVAMPGTAIRHPTGLQRMQDNLDHARAAYSAWLAERMQRDFEPLRVADMTSQISAEAESTPEDKLEL